jgi:2-polyprenyl-3-methyl-5-hydroxy-6-metoxy-1,4-benzoquinol methylase
VVNWLTPGGLTYSFSRCENPACGHAWLRAPSSSEAVDAYPANYYTHQPAPTGLVARSVARAKRSGLGHALGYVMYLQDMTPGRVLEVGCGSGARLAELRGMGWDVQGIEPDATAAAVAQDYYHLPVLVATLEQGTFPPASFDAVVMTHVIEHVPDPLPLLRACRTVLSPGGKLVVTCPNIDAYGHRRYGASWTALDPPRHEHLFTRASLMALARAAGFLSVEARTSIRGAWGNFGGSEQLRATGRRGGAGAALRAKALALVAYELVRLTGDPLAGEEIAMVCTR